MKNAAVLPPILFEHGVAPFILPRVALCNFPGSGRSQEKKKKKIWQQAIAQFLLGLVSNVLTFQERPCREFNRKRVDRYIYF